MSIRNFLMVAPIGPFLPEYQNHPVTPQGQHYPGISLLSGGRRDDQPYLPIRTFSTETPPATELLTEAAARLAAATFWKNPSNRLQPHDFIHLGSIPISPVPAQSGTALTPAMEGHLLAINRWTDILDLSVLEEERGIWYSYSLEEVMRMQQVFITRHRPARTLHDKTMHMLTLAATNSLRPATRLEDLALELRGDTLASSRG